MPLTAVKPIDPEAHGVSFSLKQCRNFGLDWHEVLDASLKDLKIRRFRLMSYWDEHEKTPGQYDFTELDEQLNIIEQTGSVVTMCLGVRQPRWPESHWPDWAWELPIPERDEALLNFIIKVVERYKDRKIIVSWQLENEAFLKIFGLRGDFDRKRIINEYKTIKGHDPTRPIVMTASNSWGIPLRAPLPDIVGFSFYRIVYDKGRYTHATYYPWVYRLRKRLILILRLRPSFIHELQAEPWGPKNIWEMPIEEQDKSMSVADLKKNISLARSTFLNPIDLWGVEWWYWRKHVMNDDTIWNTIKTGTWTLKFKIWTTSCNFSPIKWKGSLANFLPVLLLLFVLLVI